MKRVLVAYDGSEQSAKALDHAVEQFPDATIIILSVIDPSEASYAGGETGAIYTEGWYDTAVTTAENRLEDARDRVDHDGSIETVHDVGKPARTIVEYAEENDLDHVVMGSQGRTGVSRIFLGSVAESVVRRSPVPVTVIR